MSGQGVTRAGILSAIGKTPVVELLRVVSPGHARVLVKLEMQNPTGSMKDPARRRSCTAPSGWRSP